MPVALLALAIGAFGIGTTEFAVTGLLPQFEAEFGVSTSTAGATATGYALGVVIGAPVIAILGAKAPPKRVLTAMMVLFVLGNALSAVAPAFSVLLAGRVVSSLAHGAFFGIGSVVAARMVAPGQRARAIALMFTGLTVANVAGVPLATLIGQRLDWRISFAAIAGVGVVALAGVLLLVPADAGRTSAQPQARGRAGSLRAELAALRHPQVLLALGMTILGFGGVFAAITYIAEMMTGSAGYAESDVTWLLILFGAGMVVGNLVGGRYADRAPMRLLAVTIGGLAALLALFTVTAHDKAAAAVTLTLIGAFGFASVPPLQKRVLDHAGGAPTLASALNIGAFNLGNALAAWLGGLVLATGADATRANLVGSGMALAALALAGAAAVLERRGAPRAGSGGRVAAASPRTAPAATEAPPAGAPR
ncbi:MFS transporter [Streptomyces sp. RFCAC02]|uniref:MFS transporter n=1 Tax=Streptomyces sp. RFCAC02 TaxID=2499143 RepID=UPI00101ECDB0|nr:MFS transporter [Streptomyces sp. RFCAC02]